MLADVAFYRYRVHDVDGTDRGESSFAVLLQPGEMVPLGGGRRMRIVAVIPVEEDDSPYVGLLQVEILER